ncbi:MarR family winged helix-turn-helix transcriptional regulator [Actinoplanes sp. HUAS TT8]|uniref:MarR family winged helix-turn-helix transcriptional regulator n=1 Tax=Actinoplanes sp. HUAS TT8 TaxID=3447453 RepID=UPI003F5282FB
MSARRGAQIYDVLRETRPLVLNSARVVEAALRDDRVSVGMRAVLEVLAGAGTLTVPGIAQRLDLARQGVQRHVDDLGELGLVAVRANPAHRRSLLVHLTDTGTALFRRIHDDELARLDQLAADCTDDEITAAVKVLRALNREVRG